MLSDTVTISLSPAWCKTFQGSGNAEQGTSERSSLVFSLFDYEQQELLVQISCRSANLGVDLAGYLNNRTSAKMMSIDLRWEVEVLY